MTLPSTPSTYDHIVIVMEENHSYSEIIGSPYAPYINLLASNGVSLTNYHGVTHPSEPNYFAVYAGSTFGVGDDGTYAEADPSMATVLAGAGRSFLGYAETGSPQKHNPWQSFPEGAQVSRSFSSFPTDFSQLPSVSMVAPNLADDMHDGSIATGDSWLNSNLSAYANWAVSHNSLLVVLWDEDDSSMGNQIPGILYGAKLNIGQYNVNLNHYDMLRSLLGSFDLAAPNLGATAAGLPSAIWAGQAGGIVLRGNDTGETMLGGSGADTLDSQGGNDTVTGGGGNDVLNGGAGIDTAVFAGAFSNYSVQFAGGTRSVDGPDGHDTLTGFERYQFSDGTIDTADGSPLVDDLYYDARYRDIYNAKIDPDAHYTSYGYKEGRDPDAFFSTTGYLAANRDIKTAGLNPLQHYDQYGWKEGRDPSTAFDTTLYLQHNPDIKALNIDPLAHYLQYGQAEGRQAYAAIGSTITADGFDAEYYLLSNPDVAASGMDPYQHYMTYGWKEGRNPNAWFDDAGYLARYADVQAAGINPLTHYDTYGWKEGRDPSAHFDTNAYESHYSDVAGQHIDPLVHYLKYGAYENRSTFDDNTLG